MTPASPVREGPWTGWLKWQDPKPATFLDIVGPSYAQADGEGRAVVMLETSPIHRNRMDALHGGFLAAFADHAYVAGLFAMGHDQTHSVTVDLSMQYLGAGKVGPLLRADVQLLRETGRLMFLRMTIAQGDAMIAASTTTLRKAPRPK